jgi:Flp pilus assembly pilin Flp
MAILGKILGTFGRRALRRRRFAADESGTTAIEFGLLGIPFFGVLAAILETSYVFLAGQILDTAVQDSARFVRTGQIHQAGFPDDTGGLGLAKFRSEICEGLYGLFDCNELWISVTPVGAFTGVTAASPVPSSCDPNNCDWALPEAYSPGTGSSIILVRVYYKWPTFINLGGFTLQNTGGNSRLLGSVRIFSNEPF